MNQAWVSGQDRRRFFRIDDVVGLSHQPADENLITPRRSDWQVELEQLDAELGAAMVRLRREQPLAAEVLGLLDRKLRTLIQHAGGADPARAPESTPEYHNTPVNISACGIAFLADQPYSAGSLLVLDLLLRPGDWQLRLFGRVIACDPVMAGWYLRMDYHNISQSDQDLLVRHMLVRQSQQLKR